MEPRGGAETQEALTAFGRVVAPRHVRLLNRFFFFFFTLPHFVVAAAVHSPDTVAGPDERFESVWRTAAPQHTSAVARGSGGTLRVCECVCAHSMAFPREGVAGRGALIARLPGTSTSSTSSTH